MFLHGTGEWEGEGRRGAVALAMYVPGFVGGAFRALKEGVYLLDC